MQFGIIMLHHLLKQPYCAKHSIAAMSNIYRPWLEDSKPKGQQLLSIPTNPAIANMEYRDSERHTLKQLP